MAVAVMYGKAIDDKELGIYIEDVYFGGVAEDDMEADEIARDCVNGIRGGTAIIKVIPIVGSNTLVELFEDARARFDKVEREMVETEQMLENNIQRAKARKR